MNIFSKIALKTIAKNRTRTWVTIIGIILSAAMFTAVTVSVSSFLCYHRNYTEYTDGTWEVAFYRLTEEELEGLSAEPEIGKLNYLQQLGFAEIPESKNENKPYLCIVGVDDHELLPIHLTEGRMPENSGEILLPEHLASNGKVVYELEDLLKLEAGKRVSGEWELDNHSGYYLEEADQETIDQTAERTYTVVGFYERPSFEDYQAPGYTAITVAEESGSGYTYDVYFKTKNESEAVHYYDQHVGSYSSGKLNSGYLRAYGISGESNYNTVLYNFAAILIGIIFFGSVALIYNSFSISVSERTRLFGVLSSVGATRKQLIKCVLAEGAFLGGIGVPAGILAGLLGMWITLQKLGEKMSEMLYVGYPEQITMQPSLAAILIAVMIAFFTIFLSAYLPVRKALKHSAIDTIRQGSEIRLKGKQVRTFGLTQILFGFEGMLAAKNFKRNRKKYRATVVSLFVSVVLFVTTSSFCSYLEKSAGVVYEDFGYDISVRVTLEEGENSETAKEIGNDIEKQMGVTQVWYFAGGYSTLMLEQKEITREYVSFLQLNEGEPDIPDQIFTDVQFVFLDDDTFDAYAKSLSISSKDYYDPQEPKALVYDGMSYYGNDQKYHLIEKLSDRKKEEFTLALVTEQEGFQYFGTWIEDGEYIWGFEDPYTQEVNYIPAAGNCDTVTIKGKLVSRLPDVIQVQIMTYFLVPYSQREAVCEKIGDGYVNTNLDQADNQLTYVVKSEDHAVTAEELERYFSASDHVEGYYITDYTENIQHDRTFIFIIDVFSYGFIVLISLIALANVFNTISTNIQLRSREFAMLRSVGMTPKGMRRMMNYECLLYGIKGLLYGLPVSILLTYLIYRSVSAGIEMRFFIPWYSLVIAIGSVFVVVFATMFYSMQKLQKENTIDAMKNENI